MQQSVLLCISTILDSGNHYTKMMELVDGAHAFIKPPSQHLSVSLLTDLGFKVFETINITLVCDECLKGDCN